MQITSLVMPNDEASKETIFKTRKHGQIGNFNDLPSSTWSQDVTIQFWWMQHSQKSYFNIKMGKHFKTNIKCELCDN
jgi:hypothetical protein